MRVLVTGAGGQLVRALLERGPARGVEVVAVGRPALDLAEPAGVRPALEAAGRADAIVNAAAFTAVDLAEAREEEAHRVNALGAGAVAAAARALGAPMVHVSTDYVFDGARGRPLREEDPTAPLQAYGRTKLAGERAVAEAAPDHAVLRAAWLHSPFGACFPRTMLRLGAERGLDAERGPGAARARVRVVADQFGSPTGALDLADAVLGVAANLVARPGEGALRGLFHTAPPDGASWAEVAEAVFAQAAAAGRPPVAVDRVGAADYPTPARRPADSRLDASRLAARHGLRLPPWRASLAVTVARLLEPPELGDTPPTRTTP